MIEDTTQTDPEPDWASEGFEGAHFDDARPLLFLYNAICERLSVCEYGAHDYHLAGWHTLRTLPRTALLGSFKEALLHLAAHAINPYHDYSLQNYATFPRFYTAEDIEQSEHPLCYTPPPGATETGYLSGYQAFLTDCLFWLRRFRLFPAPYMEYGKSFRLRKNTETGDFEWQDAGESGELGTDEEAFYSYVWRERAVTEFNTLYDETSINGAYLSDIRVGNTAPFAARAILVARYTGGVYDYALDRAGTLSALSGKDSRPGSEGQVLRERTGEYYYSSIQGLYNFHYFSDQTSGALASGERVLFSGGLTDDGAFRYEVIAWDESLTEHYSVYAENGTDSPLEPSGSDRYDPAVYTERYIFTKTASPLFGVAATGDVPAHRTSLVLEAPTAPSAPALPDYGSSSPPEGGALFDYVEERVGPVVLYPCLDFGETFAVLGEPLPPPFMPS